MSKGYVLALITVTDLERYQASGYPELADKSVAAFGGRFLVRGGDAAALEGPALTERVVVLEFPTRDDAAAFHASEMYAPALALRQSFATSRLTLLSGYEA